MSALTAADIIVRPVISEKSIDVSTIGDRDAKAGNKYTFAVHRDANKIQIREAVEKTFNVQVKAVNTLNMPRKERRRGRRWGQVPGWKKAIVTLVPGQTIDIFEA